MVAIAPAKLFLIALAGTAAVGTTAYYSGALDRYIYAPPAPVAAPAPAKPAEAPAKTDRVEPPAAAEAKPEAPAAAPAPSTALVAPSFDLVRVEADGSIVIAGRAAANANVEVLAGSRVIGTAKAGPEGDFAVVVEDRLAPGNYQIVLRATDPQNVIAMSPETAVVSVPQQKDGQVLALVEQPGQPSRLITVPEPEPAKVVEPKAAEAPAAPAAQAAPAVSPAPAATEAATPAETPAATTAEAPAAKPGEQTPPPAIKMATVEVRAVEIEGNKVFIAGVAEPNGLVRAYANEIMLGETRASPTGEFLVEALRDLPVGDYIVRADLIGPDGIRVLRRAQVPFRRPEGEAVAAVAPVAKPAPAEAAAPQPEQPGQAQAQAQAVVPAPQPVEQPATTAAALQPVDGSVIIRRGDTLWQISRRVYGRGVRYSTIYLANQQQIADPDRIWPGQVFSVPGKTEEGEAANMDAVADQVAPAEGDGAASR